MNRLIFINRVYPPAAGATGQLLRDLAEGLAQRGLDVTVITGGPEAKANLGGVQVWQTGGALGHGTGLVSKAWGYRRFTRGARRALATLLRPGDVVVPMTDPPLLASDLHAVASRVGAHLIPWVQDIHPEVVQALLPPAWRWAGGSLAWARQRRNRTWRAATHIVAPGHDMARVIGRTVPSPGRVTVIPNWAPHRLSPPDVADIARFRSAQGWDGKHVLMYSGNLGRVHQVGQILQLAESLRARADIVIAIMGNGPRAHHLRRERERRRLDQMVFLPPCSLAELGPALAAGDVHLVTLHHACTGLVWPSKFYGIMAVERPVLYLGPAEAEVASLIQQHELGHLVTPGEMPTALAWLETLFASPAKQAAYRDRCRTFNHHDGGLKNRLSSWFDLMQTYPLIPPSDPSRSDSRPI